VSASVDSFPFLPRHRLYPTAAYLILHVDPHKNVLPFRTRYHSPPETQATTPVNLRAARLPTVVQTPSSSVPWPIQLFLLCRQQQSRRFGSVQFPMGPMVNLGVCNCLVSFIAKAIPSTSRVFVGVRSRPTICSSTHLTAVLSATLSTLLSSSHDLVSI